MHHEHCRNMQAANGTEVSPRFAWSDLKYVGYWERVALSLIIMPDYATAIYGVSVPQQKQLMLFHTS
jgi:hypothetical protein